MCFFEGLILLLIYTICITLGHLKTSFFLYNVDVHMIKINALIFMYFPDQLNKANHFS